MTSGTKILLAGTAAVLLMAGLSAKVLFSFSHSAPPQTIVEAPRTDSPMEKYTPYFTRKKFEITNQQQKRVLTYYWLAPKQEPPPGTKLPLVVVLHGSPGKSYAAEYFVSDEMQHESPAFVLVPQAPEGKTWAIPKKYAPQEYDQFWSNGYPYYPQLESLPDVVEILHQLEKEYPIDPSRVYIIGCSEGGTGAYAAALRYPGVFAAAVAISGAWSYLDVPQMTRVPLLILYGSLENSFIVQFNRTAADSIKREGGNATAFEFANMGHECPSPLLYEKPLWKWMFRQKKAG